MLKIDSKAMKSMNSKIGLRIVFAAFAWCAATPSSQGAESESTTKMPRFASMAAQKVSVRVGPSRSYPIEWIFQHKSMPVEITQEFEHWRKIRDHEGAEGWVQAGKISSARTVMAKHPECKVFASPDTASTLVATMEQSSIAKLRQCRAAWCEIEAQDVHGWVEKQNLWGVYPQEEVSPKRCWIPFFCR